MQKRKETKCIENVIESIANKYQISKIQAAEHVDKMEAKIKNKIDAYTKGEDIEIPEAIKQRIKDEVKSELHKNIQLKMLHMSRIKSSFETVKELYNSDLNIDKYESLASFLGGSATGIKGSRLSVESSIKASIADLNNRLFDKLDVTIKGSGGNEVNLFDIFKIKATDKNFNNDVYREILNIKKGNDTTSTGNIEAFHIAKAFEEARSEGYDMARTAEFPVEERDDVIFKNIHDTEKMLGNKFSTEGKSVLKQEIDAEYKRMEVGVDSNKRSKNLRMHLVARNVWTNKMLDLLDLGKVYGDDVNFRYTGKEDPVGRFHLKGINTYGIEVDLDYGKIKSDLYSSFERIVSGEHRETEINIYDFTSRYEKTMNITNKFSGGRRKYHFKDAEAWIKYKDLYGTDSNYNELMTNTMNNLGLDIGFLKTLGPDPENALAKLIELHKQPVKTDFANKEYGGYAKTSHEYTQLTQTQEKKIWQIMDELTGLANMPVNNTLAKVSRNIRGFNVFTKMWGSGITSIVGDATTGPFAMKNAGFEFMEANTQMVKNLVDGLKGKYNDEEIRTILRRVSNYMENETLNIIDRYGNTDKFTGLIKKGSDAAIKFSGLEGVTKAGRKGYALWISQEYGDLCKTPFKDLNSDMQTTLKKYGFDEDHWEAFGSAIDDVDIYGKNLLTVEIVDKISEDKLLKLFDKDYPDKRMVNFKLYKQLLKDNIRTMITGIIDDAILTPGARDLATLHMGTRAGTVLGESIRMVGFLRSFGMTYLTRVTETLANKNGVAERGIIGAAKSLATSHKMELMQLAMWSLTMGTLGVVASDALRGKIVNPSEMTAEDYGKFLVKTINKSGFGGLYGDLILNVDVGYGKSIMDNMLGLPFQQAANALEVAYTSAASGEVKTKSIVNFLNQNAVPNILVAKAVWDRTLYAMLQEYIDPGYMAKQRRKQRKDKGTYHFIGGF